MRPIQTRKQKLLRCHFPGEFQMQAAAPEATAASQELCHLAKPLIKPPRPETKYPVRGIPHFDILYIDSAVHY